MAHDTYYSNLPDTDVLKAELTNYIAHINDCLEEDGILRDTKLDMQSQKLAAEVVLANLERVYE